MHTKQCEARRAEERLVQANEQLTAVRDRMRDSTKSSDSERAVWRDFSTQFDSSRRSFGVGGGGGFGGFGGPPNLRTLASGLKGQLMQATALPTATQMRRIERLRSDL
ncbi:MAG: hypothetical protein ACT4R6_08470, partial [Gemmatimonadaceae bacterium]